MKNNIIEIILHIIGVFFIYECIYLKRNKESEIKDLSKDWWYIFILIFISIVLLRINI